MHKTVTVRNTSDDRILVGDRYLLPGEQREVLASHLETAAGKDRLLVIGSEVPAVEPAAAVEADAVAAPEQAAEKPARRTSRSGK